MQQIPDITSTTASHARKLRQSFHDRVVSAPEEIVRFDALLREKRYLKESVRVGVYAPVCGAGRRLGGIAGVESCCLQAQGLGEMARLKFRSSRQAPQTGGPEPPPSFAQ